MRGIGISPTMCFGLVRKEKGADMGDDRHRGNPRGDIRHDAQSSAGSPDQSKRETGTVVRALHGLRTCAVFLFILFGPMSACFGQRAGCPIAEDRGRHSEHGIVLDYPSNWRVQRGEDGGVRALALFPEGFTFENSPCSLQVLWM